MEIHLNNTLSDQLQFFAAQTGQAPDSLVSEALTHHFEELKNAHLRAAIAKGDASMAKGRVYDAGFMTQIAADARARVAKGDISTNSDATGF